MYQVTITNTFPSENDCDMFVMVLQQQWPSFMDRLAGGNAPYFPVRNGSECDAGLLGPPIQRTGR